MATPTTFELALRDAIRARLKADAGFNALAAKRIYDEVPTSSGKAIPLPTDPVPPYAYFGPIRRSNKVLDCIRQDMGLQNNQAETLAAAFALLL